MIQRVMQRGFLYSGILKLAYFLIGIRKNCVYFGGFRKVIILSNKQILHFKGQDPTDILLKQKFNSVPRNQ